MSCFPFFPRFGMPSYDAACAPRMSSVAQLDDADYLHVYSASLGMEAAASLPALAAWLRTAAADPQALVTQYAAPSATGFSVAVAPPAAGVNVFLLLTPIAGYAAGSIVLPAPELCVNGQQLLVVCTQAVTALTVNGNGSTVNGAPAGLVANGFFRLRYDGVMQAWYRVG